MFFKDWFPILLVGLSATLIVLGLAKGLTKHIFYTLAAILSLLCCLAILISVIVVGGWAGMGMGVVAITVFLGIVLGVILSPLIHR